MVNLVLGRRRVRRGRPPASSATSSHLREDCRTWSQDDALPDRRCAGVSPLYEDGSPPAFRSSYTSTFERISAAANASASFRDMPPSNSAIAARSKKLTWSSADQPSVVASVGVLLTLPLTWRRTVAGPNSAPRMTTAATTNPTEGIQGLTLLYQRSRLHVGDGFQRRAASSGATG